MTTLSASTIERDRNFPFNFVVNVADGAFFGLAIGFTSFSTVLPLFVSNLTDSAILIGLIPAIHVMGWQLPQLFIAHRVSKQKRYKPMVMFFTIHERIPFLGLAVVSWFIPKIGPGIALFLIFALLVWQGLGGGFTANAWQSMVGKIIPQERWGLFFGIQSSAGALFSSGGAVIAGLVLAKYTSNNGFTICFLLSCAAFVFSYISISLTREAETPPVAVSTQSQVFWKDMQEIIKRDIHFRWFVAARILSQLGTVGFAFYTVYVVRHYGADELTAGILTALMMISQTIFNPIMGWLGDRWSYRGVMGLGLIAAAISASVAVWAPTVGWFYLAYPLAGIAFVATWTIAMAMTLEYGQEHEKPTYIGMANTLIAPTAFIIPLLGGWLADFAGYQATFIATAVGAVAAASVLSFVMRVKPVAIMREKEA